MKRFSLSPHHLQRTFKRIVGVSPRQYVAGQRLARFKGELKDGKTVTDALYDAGFQSSSIVSMAFLVPVFGLLWGAIFLVGFVVNYGW